MRRLSFATLIFAVTTTFFMGCRQAAGPSMGGTMSSGSMSSMSPAMQSPSFNPFGGSTRVSPPPPNASATQNPYIGGPPGQTNTAHSAVGGFVSAAPGAAVPPLSGQVVGSGVQPAGFAGNTGNPTMQAGFTNNHAAPIAPVGAGTTAVYGNNNPANVNQFRAGGMQVNDLTRAPLPPGYRASGQTTSLPVGTAAPAGMTTAQPVFTPASAPLVPASGVPASGAPVAGVSPTSIMAPIQPTQYQQPQAWQGSNTTVNQNAEIASRMVPVTPNPSASAAPVTQTGTTSASTQSSGNAGGSDLMWRRPGS